MTSIKGHFYGTAILLDEPAMLAVGQPVRIVVDSSPSKETPKPRPSLAGFAKGMLQMREDFNDPLDEFAEYR